MVANELLLIVRILPTQRSPPRAELGADEGRDIVKRNAIIAPSISGCCQYHVIGKSDRAASASKSTRIYRLI
jgi:hypothetical protein